MLHERIYSSPLPENKIFSNKFLPFPYKPSKGVLVHTANINIALTRSNDGKSRAVYEVAAAFGKDMKSAYSVII